MGGDDKLIPSSHVLGCLDVIDKHNISDIRQRKRQPTMTTYMQEEYEALALEQKPIITDVKVNSTITNHPDELTDKELEKVTSVFRSLETGLREASIYPRVSGLH